MTSRPPLPPLDEASALAATAGAALSEVARAPYSQAASDRITQADDRLGAGVFSNPLGFAHEVADAYLICAGDFICGLQYVVNPDTNLMFSSASLARSACEYANRARWLADPALTVNQRIARGIAVVDNTLKEEKEAFETSNLHRLEELQEHLNGWRHTRDFKETASLPRPTRLFDMASPEIGKLDYKRLCNATHGSFLTVITSRNAAAQGTDEGRADTWWRVLTACRYGINAADRITQLQENEWPETLKIAHALHSLCVERCIVWEDA